MRLVLARSAALLTSLAALLAHPGAGQATPVADAAVAAAPAPTPDPAVHLGTLSREQIVELQPDWVLAGTGSIDAEAAHELMGIAPGARVTVYFGTWCSDSRRELGRFWHALDEALGMAALDIEYIGVDRDKLEPAERLRGVGLTHVPTFVVERDGKELGRIVEQAPHGIERDIADLLSARASGYLSATQPPPSSGG